MDLRAIRDIIQNEGANLYDTELVSENKHNIFRVYITCKDGVTLDLCAKISNIISPILDLDPPTQKQYFLEVSSPGLERKLKKTEHFKNSIGELLRVHLVSTEKVEGKLISADNEGIMLEGEEQKIKYDEIEKAKTYVIW